MSAAPWKVSLRNNVKAVDVDEVERVFCRDLPNGMKDRANLPHEKTSNVCEYKTHVEGGHNLPSNPGGGRSGPPSPSTEKIAVSHLPVGHSSLGGDAKSLRGGEIGECGPFI